MLRITWWFTSALKMGIFVHYFQRQTLSQTLICSVRPPPQQMRTEKPENFLFTKQEKKGKRKNSSGKLERASILFPMYIAERGEEKGGGEHGSLSLLISLPFPNYRLERRKLDLILLLIDRPIYFREKQYLLLLQYLPNDSCQVSTKI